MQELVRELQSYLIDGLKLHSSSHSGLPGCELTRLYSPLVISSTVRATSKYSSRSRSDKSEGPSGSTAIVLEIASSADVENVVESAMFETSNGMRECLSDNWIAYKVNRDANESDHFGSAPAIAD